VSPRGAATDGADKRIARKQSSGTQLSSNSNGNSGGGNLNQMPVARRRLTSIHLFDDPATIGAEASEHTGGNSSSDEADNVLALEDQDEIERRRQHYIQRDKTMNKITSAYTLMRERACVCD
jgi:hypothetical protein